MEWAAHTDHADGAHAAGVTWDVCVIGAHHAELPQHNQVRTGSVDCYLCNQLCHRLGQKTDERRGEEMTYNIVMVSWMVAVSVGIMAFFLTH